AVERGDEALIEGADDAFDELVADLFFLLEFEGAFGQLIEGGDHVEELDAGARQGRRHLIEHVEELELPRNEAETHARASSRRAEASQLLLGKFIPFLLKTAGAARHWPGAARGPAATAAPKGRPSVIDWLGVS